MKKQEDKNKKTIYHEQLHEWENIVHRDQEEKRQRHRENQNIAFILGFQEFIKRWLDNTKHGPRKEEADDNTYLYEI